MTKPLLYYAEVKQNVFQSKQRETCYYAGNNQEGVLLASEADLSMLWMSLANTSTR